jgi:hypothetical protein
MKSKNQALQAEIDDLNAKDRYGNLATIKVSRLHAARFFCPSESISLQSNEKRIAQTKQLIEKQQTTVDEESEVAYLAEREKGLADANLAREENDEPELLRAEERMRQEEGHLSECVLAFTASSSLDPWFVGIRCCEQPKSSCGAIVGARIKSLLLPKKLQKKRRL